MPDTDQLPLHERLLAHSRTLGDEQDNDLRRDSLPPHLRPVFDDLLLAAQALETRQHEVAHLHKAAARRNVQLDALGIVWCDGGCPGGMHRHHPDREVTAKQVAELVANAGRAVAWFVNNAGRVSDRTGTHRAAWESARAEVIAATPKAFQKMVDRAAAGEPRLARTSADQVTSADHILIIDDRLGDPRLWRRDPAGDTPLGMLCFADMSGERTLLRPGETCHRLVISEASHDHV